MKWNKFTIITLCIMFFCIGVFAQPPEGDLRERMETLKVSFITKKVQLNTEEAKLFWPVYNEFDAEKQQLREKRRALMKELKEGDGNVSQMDNNVEILMDLKLKDAELDQKYYETFKEVVGVEKAAAFFKAEEEFKRILLRHHREGPPEGEDRLPPR